MACPEGLAAVEAAYSASQVEVPAACPEGLAASEAALREAWPAARPGRPGRAEWAGRAERAGQGEQQVGRRALR